MTKIIKLKTEIILELIERLRVLLEDTKKQYGDAKQASVESPGRMQSRYDSSKEEFNYTAQALQEIINGTEKSIDELESLEIKQSGSIEVGAFINVEKNNGERVYFILPAGGGEIFEKAFEGRDIIVVTPVSPVGKGLSNKNVSDEIFIGENKLKIISVF